MNVSFEMTDTMEAEVRKIQALAGLESVPEVFRHAFTLLRIHVKATVAGDEILMVSKTDTQTITLPFMNRP